MMKFVFAKNQKPKITYVSFIRRSFQIRGTFTNPKKIKKIKNKNLPLSPSTTLTLSKTLLISFFLSLKNFHGHIINSDIVLFFDRPPSLLFSNNSLVALHIFHFLKRTSVFFLVLVLSHFHETEPKRRH